tara:strand:+ start:411 stop:785 length:375 start_codon:yes stop_codon:yes gene_type:complete
MTHIFNISIPSKIVSNVEKKSSQGKKLWYDIKSKKMIEVDGELLFSYNYSNSTLKVSGRECLPNKIHNSLNQDISVLDKLRRDFDFDILSKNVFQNSIEVTLELYSDSFDFKDALDDLRLKYTS